MDKIYGGGRKKLGGICSILIGVSYISLIIYAVIIPPGQRYDTYEFFKNYIENPFYMNFAWIIMALTSILAFAVIPAVSDDIKSEDETWIPFGNILGTVGFSVSAASFLTMLGRTPAMAQLYINSDSSARAAIAAVGLPQLDPYNILVLGGVGIWYLIINITALKRRIFSKFHGLSGIILGVFMWSAVFAAILKSELLDQIAAGAGAVFAPIWYIGLGVHLLKRFKDK